MVVLVDVRVGLHRAVAGAVVSRGDHVPGVIGAGLDGLADPVAGSVPHVVVDDEAASEYIAPFDEDRQTGLVQTVPAADLAAGAGVAVVAVGDAEGLDDAVADETSRQWPNG